MKRSSAFTLIELLVVIAIIAILAAILFPVFAQAKDAAKNAASLSNVKQIDLSSIMYQNDADDLVPIAMWISPVSGEFYVWTRATQPYRKNWDIMYSPSGGPHAIASWMNIFTNPAFNWEGNWQYFPQYGMNASYLNKTNPDCSDIQIAGNVFGPPISTSAAAQPAGTVAYTETGQDAPEDNVGTPWVYPPGGNLANDVCTYGDWGPAVGMYDVFSGNTGTNRAGFFRPRHSGGGVVSFLDGHAKLVKTGALAIGTDWNINQAYGTAVITDRSKYLWDLQ